MHGLCPFGSHAERAREREEIDSRIDQLHADIAVSLRREPAHGVQPLLENAVGAVVEDDEYRADGITRCRPQRLTGI